MLWSMKSLLVEVEVRAAILKALWEAEEQVTAEAYARQPDSLDAAFDPAVWEGRGALGTAAPRRVPREPIL